MPEFSQFIQSIQSHSLTRNALAHMQQKQRWQMSLALFLIYWAKSSKGRLHKSQIIELQKLTAPWHNKIVRHLQQVITQIEQCKTVKSRQICHLLVQEKDAALRVEQMLLRNAEFDAGKRRRNDSQILGDTCVNLALYIQMLNLSINEQDREALIMLVQGAFPDKPYALIQTELQNALHNHAPAIAGEQLDLYS